jgi:hypothetical protein
MESCESSFEGLRHLFIWTAAFLLGLIIFVTVDNLLEPNSPSAECRAGEACWDVRSMWN